ncbi:MAG: hypothetical protein PHY69_05905 [Dysgonamonadaceae bacterium]|jgi:hypothetical protein|nr:hypothetical protein [Dysgonamonadaceae bacterium]MDD3309475.1 hypothetical protein [Dysgonamonadaceae bacterium]MDD3901002.1 hypothetical protein [Dysgonamonadaceae bacterium]MDD4399528.1 hypothetical protein [Dysgonamonadaceae bacterium]
MSVKLSYVEKIEKAVGEISEVKAEVQSTDLAIIYVAEKYDLRPSTLHMVITSSKTRDSKWKDVNKLIDTELSRIRNAKQQPMLPPVLKELSL